MASSLNININKPIHKIDIIDCDTFHAEVNLTKKITEQKEMLNRQLEEKLEENTSLSKVLQQSINDCELFMNKCLNDHKDVIARLAVEIASKIIFKEIEAERYDITKVIEQGLSKISDAQSITIKLNPADHDICVKASTEPGSLLNGISFGSEPNISRGECLIETDKGIVEYYHDDALKNIAAAIGNA